MSLKEQLNQKTRMYCSNLTTEENHCPAEISEILGLETCWAPTLAGTMANVSCPPLEIFKTNAFAYKECWPNATWFTNPGSNQGWTNYTECMDWDELEFNTFINQLSVIGYSISLVAVFLSFVVFSVFRSLRCTRIRIHIQLFLSFIMNNIAFIIWYIVVIPSWTQIDPWLCKAVDALRRYLLVANYMWMFCESLYLHISLVMVFVRDEIAWIWFLFVGWGVSFVIIFAYCVARIYYFQDAQTQSCWIDESRAELIYIIPVCVTLILSLGFLMNVLRVILTIMRSNSENPAAARVKKAARATFILLPLFGLQYFVIPFRPGNEHPYFHLYQYVSVVVTTLQGLWVAILFCFANRDVHHAILGCVSRKLSTTRWSNYLYTTGTADSAGVYVINSNHIHSIHLV